MQMERDLLVFFFLGFLVPLQNTKAATVQIGAITNPTTRIGREQKVAVQLAVEKFSGLTLPANVIDLNNTDPSPVSSYVQNLIKLGANAIIAGGTVPQVFISGTVGEGAKVPVVSIASSPFLSGTFLIQMSYSETAIVRCFADIVKSYKWRKVIAVYEDDIFGSVSSSALLLSNALEAIGSELEYRAILPPADSTSDPRSSVREELVQAKLKVSTVYIILRISEALASILFEEAVSQGMMSKGNIWICSNDITTLLDSSFTPSFISKNMKGVVGIRSYINETTPEFFTFLSNFEQRFRSQYENSSEKSFDPGVYAVRAYDAVHAISLAATTSEKNNKTLVENLMASNFSGLSGLMRPINGSFDESEKYSAFRIINVVGRSYNEMGIWVDGHGFYENEVQYMLLQSSSEKLKSIVFWPGSPLTTPSGLRMLKVGVPATNTIWTNFVSVDKIGNSVSYSGFCIDVFTATLSCLGYEVLYEYVPYNIDDYDKLVSKVYSREVDIVVGDVTILANRSEHVYFTKPYLSSGLAMLVPVKTDTKGWLPTKAFSSTLWICILLLFLYYLMLVWLHMIFPDGQQGNQENGQQGNQVDGQQGNQEKSEWTQLGASLWIVCNGIFLNLDTRIKSYHIKVVIILWFFVAQLVLNSFTASLSSILVTQNLRPDVDTKKIGCDGNSFVPNYLTSVLNYSPESIVRVYSASDYKKSFENGTITAAYLEVPYLRVFLSQHENYTSNGEIQMLGGFGFVLPKGSILANDMSEAILMLGENGTLRQLEKKWFSVSLSNYAPPDDENNQSLGLSDYTYMFVISSCLAFLTLIHGLVVFCRGGGGVAPEPGSQRPHARDSAVPVVEPVPVGITTTTTTPVSVELVHVGGHVEEPEPQAPEVQHKVLTIGGHLGAPEEARLGPHEPEEELGDVINAVPGRQLKHSQPMQQDQEGINNAQAPQESDWERIGHAASSSNLSTGTRFLQSFCSFDPKREHETNLDGSHESGEPSCMVRSKDAEPSQSNVLRQRYYRRKINLNPQALIISGLMSP